MPEPTRILKFDSDNNLVFGWASVAIKKDGEQVHDSQDDLIDPLDLELTAYVFNLQFRETGEMHVGKAQGQLVESIVFTKEKLKALKLPEDALPEGWWVGFYIPDDDVFKKVKDGTYRMFSIEGNAVREDI